MGDNGKRLSVSFTLTFGSINAQVAESLLAALQQIMVATTMLCNTDAVISVDAGAPIPAVDPHAETEREPSPESRVN